MPNHPSVIARPTETGWEGRYVHNDGHPTTRIPLLRALYAGPFASDLAAMTAFLLDAHPAGWSQLGVDPTIDTGWDNSRSDVHYGGFICYCHGDRSEDPWLHTEDTTDCALADWVYVLRPEGVDVIDLGDGATTTMPWQEADDEDVPWPRPEATRAAPLYEPARAAAGASNDGHQLFATFYDANDRCQACVDLPTDMAEAFANAILAAVKENRETRAGYARTTA